MSSLRYPPLDGTISVIPGFVDFHATHNSHCPWAILAPDHPGGKALPVSFLEFSNATHRVAYWLNSVGNRVEGQVVAILANCDTVLYLALFAGIIRAGLTPFPISPRNSSEALVHLLKTTSCTRVLVHGMPLALMATVRAELRAIGLEPQMDDIPPLAELFPHIVDALAPDHIDPYPIIATDPVEHPALYLHSSGSTGLPKPVLWKQRQLLQICRSSSVRDAREHGVKWAAMALPTFHAMGMIVQVCAPLGGGQPMALYWPKYPAPPTVPSPQNTLDACKITACTGMPCVPAFVEAWSHSDENIKYLASLSIVLFAGGPLSQKVGERLSQAGVPISAWYGGTEFGPPTKIFNVVDATDSRSVSMKTKEDWQWMEIATDVVKCRWEPQGDGTYEFQVLSSDTWIPAVENMPDERGHATGDLWEPHPTKPLLWRITGRKDDVLVLSSGEKFVPIPQEGSVTSSPLVSGAVMFGRGKTQCGILIELSKQTTLDIQDQAQIVVARNQIWPVIEEANAGAPSFAKIFKEMILFASPDRPLPRAAKGTVIRKQALKLYSKDIDDLYKHVADSSGLTGIVPPSTWSAEDIESWLSQQAASLCEKPSISTVDDIFEQGFDSLHATVLRNRIIAALRLSKDEDARKAAQEISPNIVFEHPSLQALALLLSALVNKTSKLEDDGTASSIEYMISKYSANLPGKVVADRVATSDVVVLVTGPAGNIGSHILSALLSEPRVRKVYALHRPNPNVNPAQRQVEVFTERGLSTAVLQSNKLKYLVGDFCEPGFGLEPDMLEEVKSTITHVIHVAWRVDFNHPLAAFENQLQGARRLLDMCATSTKSAKLLFLSSISSTHRWDLGLGSVPEDVISTPYVATSSGYGASKFVVENILGMAYENGLECTSLRVGQVCASKVKGAWATHEWVPSLIKSSISLGAFPQLEGTISWIPADSLARAILNLVLSSDRIPPLLNLVNPHETRWSEFLCDLKRSLVTPNTPIVPLMEWVKMVEDISTRATPEDIKQVPAIKLLGFFRNMVGTQERASFAGIEHMEAGGLPVYRTERFQSHCASARELGRIEAGHIDSWIAYWREKDFIAPNI